MPRAIYPTPILAKIVVCSFCKVDQ